MTACPDGSENCDGCNVMMAMWKGVFPDGHEDNDDIDARDAIDELDVCDAKRPTFMMKLKTFINKCWRTQSILDRIQIRLPRLVALDPDSIK